MCANKELFSSYAPAGPDETILMGYSSTAKIEGVGKIALKMTSGKTVALNQVLHFSEIRKNLVSTSLFVKNRFKCIFVSNSVALSKNDMYVGKGYLNEGLFKLNVIAVPINKKNVSSYLLKSKHFMAFTFRSRKLQNIAKDDKSRSIAKI